MSTRSWPLTTWIGILCNRAGGGPCSTWPVRASYTPPWQGQMNSVRDGSYCTGQPACVHTALNATKVLPSGRTTHAGFPLAGSVKDRA